MAKKSVEHWHHKTTWYQRRKDLRTAGQKFSDNLANFLGSWNFIILQSLLILLWLGLNAYGYIHNWDPYPFLLLSLIINIQAAYTAPIIIMSQNRQSEHDRLQAEADFKTTLEAKAEIEALRDALAQLERSKLDEILKRLPVKKTVRKKSAPKR